MKKIVSVLACLVLMFSLAGCGDSDLMVLTPYGDAVIKDDANAVGSNVDKVKEKQDSAGGQEETEDEPQNEGGGDKIHVGFAQVGAESGWRMAQTESMKSTFSAENGYQFDFVDCNNDPDTQKSAIQKFIDDGVEYIVLDPIIEDGYDDVLKEASDANIPVIVVDRKISADESLYSCWVGSDFSKEGQDAANWLADYLKQEGRDGEEINILTILGSDNASATIGRTDGFEEVAGKYANWKLLDKQTGDFTQDGGNAVMKAYLKKYSDIDVVVCQNDDEAFGAIEAIEEAGLSCGPDGDIIMISFDATKAGFEQMVAGKIHVDVECNPLEGPLVAELVQQLRAGQTPEKIQYMEEGVYPADTAEQTIGSRVY